MTDKVHKWRIYCNTEAAFQHWWLESDTVGPTTCPNDTGHSVNSSSVSLDYNVSSNSMSVIEEPDVKTGGRYRIKHFNFMMCPGTNTIVESFPFPVGALAMQYSVTPFNIGDEFNLDVSNVTVGALGADASIGATVLTVSSTVLDNIQIGFTCSITDLVNLNELGYVLDKDTNASTITVETATTHAFLAATPTYVRMTIHRGSLICATESEDSFGQAKIGASHVPANTPLTMTYINNSTLCKTFTVAMEILF